MLLILRKLFLNPTALLIIGLIGAVVFLRVQSTRLRNAKTQVEILSNNSKAYEQSVVLWQDLYGQEHARSTAFQETIQDFRKSTDSINVKIKQVLKEQDIKMKHLETVIYSKNGIDTILYKNINIPTMPDTSIDLSNEYIHNIVHLSPTVVSSDISLENELYGTFSTKKVTVDKPSSIFFIRWFQKKQTIIEADLFNTNPLIKTKNQKIVKIVE